MCGNPNIQHVQKPTNTELTIESRLIHHIITHNILPRSGSYEYISYLDLFLIWCILNKVKLDLAFYIAWHMDTCVKKKNATLPYGLNITSILEKFEVNLSGERETQKVLPLDVYGITTMKQMRYTLRENIGLKRMQLWKRNLMRRLKWKGMELKEMKKQCMRMKSLQLYLQWLLAPLMLMRITFNKCLGVWTP